MSYSPGVSDMSGQFRAQGISQAGNSIAQMFNFWTQKKEQEKEAAANAKADENWINNNAAMFGGEDKAGEITAVRPNETPLARAQRLKQTMHNTVTGVTIQAHQAQAAAENARAAEINARNVAFNKDQYDRQIAEQRLRDLSQFHVLSNTSTPGADATAPDAPSILPQFAPSTSGGPTTAAAAGAPASGPASLGNMTNAGNFSQPARPGNLTGLGVYSPQAQASMNQALYGDSAGPVAGAEPTAVQRYAELFAGGIPASQIPHIYASEGRMEASEARNAARESAATARSTIEDAKRAIDQAKLDARKSFEVHDIPGTESKVVVVNGQPVVYHPPIPKDPYLARNDEMLKQGRISQENHDEYEKAAMEHHVSFNPNSAAALADLMSRGLGNQGGTPPPVSTQPQSVKRIFDRPAPAAGANTGPRTREEFVSAYKAGFFKTREEAIAYAKKMGWPLE